MEIDIKWFAHRVRLTYEWMVDVFGVGTDAFNEAMAVLARGVTAVLNVMEMPDQGKGGNG